MQILLLVYVPKFMKQAKALPQSKTEEISPAMFRFSRVAKGKVSVGSRNAPPPPKVWKIQLQLENLTVDLELFFLRPNL